ncbi:hypothetical protein TRFO_21554 [Tritrichomonas foetus]|uniref:Uncharacterized protein n=1 Tax=Tritrichomonas foetus TaxID=1144522 RepID=A0A1J4KJH2_9EUKA|nr:hypothetical protein TRFO_21554 [Tritrichomonas foetus]|eukprot:OHT09509.1 hypothetical protein TRFO_21554 [Tritrichomonas foetus]
MNDYKTTLQQSRESQMFQRIELEEQIECDEHVIFDNLKTINQLIDMTINLIRKNDNNNILCNLSQIYENKMFLKFYIQHFQNPNFIRVLEHCLSSSVYEIIEITLKIIFSLICENNNFISNLFLPNFSTPISNFCGSIEINSIKLNALKVVCKLSEFASKESIIFWPAVKTNSISVETANFVAPFIYRILPHLLTDDFSESYCEELFDTFDFLINCGRNHAKYDTFYIIQSGIETSNQRFIHQLIQKNWISTFIQMIHDQELRINIVIGYDTLSLLLPYLNDEILNNDAFFDIELINEHLTFLEKNGKYTAKYDDTIVLSCLNFLKQIIDNHLISIQKIFQFEEFDIPNKIFMIIFHSKFKFRLLAGDVLISIIQKGSGAQVTSLSFVFIIESLLNLLAINHGKAEEIFDSLSRVLNLFAATGRTNDEFLEYFYAFDASEIFGELIEERKELVDVVTAFCTLIKFPI